MRALRHHYANLNLPFRAVLGNNGIIKVYFSRSTENRLVELSKGKKNRCWAIECKKLWCCNVYCSITLTSACEQANLCEFGENFWRRSRQRKPLACERSGARKVVLLPRSRFCLVTRQKRFRGRLLLLSCPMYLEKVRLTFSGSVEKNSLFDIDSR